MALIGNSQAHTEEDCPGRRETLETLAAAGLGPLPFPLLVQNTTYTPSPGPTRGILGDGHLGIYFRPLETPQCKPYMCARAYCTHVHHRHMKLGCSLVINCSPRCNSHHLQVNKQTHRSPAGEVPVSFPVPRQSRSLSSVIFASVVSGPGNGVKGIERKEDVSTRRSPTPPTPTPRQSFFV